MFTSIWSKKELFYLRLLVYSWLVSVLTFCAWWFQPQHIISYGGYILTTLVVFWPLITLAYCFYFVLRMRRLANTSSFPIGARVAMIVTKTPAEPFTVVANTLLKMLDQKYPHDTWVADEDPTSEALDWYATHQIYVSSRKDDPDYHNDSWPRRKRSKEGNLAYFYEKYGYQNYDFVIQMDVDHAPEPGYLEHMLVPFSNPLVGYAAASSVCDVNNNQSWAARARTHSEAMFHGPIQAGSNDGWAPLCIGSHYAIRTQALQQIGGIGPDLAEDYSTTLLFNAHGWQGVLVFEAEAHGDGPLNFNDLITQDYQWANSLFTLFLTLFPKLWSKFSLRQKLQFTFTELWYPICAFVWCLSLILPITALLTGTSPVNVNFLAFLAYSLIPYTLGFVIFYYVRAAGHVRPRQIKLFSWESAIFEITRWPWVLLAIVNSTLAVIFKLKTNFKITPKDSSQISNLPLKAISPFLLVSFISLLALAFRQNASQTQGYYWFVLASGWLYLCISTIIIILHYLETTPTQNTFYNWKRLPRLISILFILMILGIGLSTNNLLIASYKQNFINHTYTQIFISHKLIS